MGGVAGPKEFSIRRPTVAGIFYPADAEKCRQVAESLIPKDRRRDVPAQGEGCGAIVPHAGWICSGRIAGEALAALAGDRAADLVVVFGAVHTPLPLERAVFCSHEMWEVPGAQIPVATNAAAELCGQADLFGVDDRFHRREHAVEVELPLVNALWPATPILPVEVPPIDEATDVGRRVAGQVLGPDRRIVFLASSDLTHYGPAYHFTPAGIGLEGFAWAKENDQRLLRLVTDLAAEQIVPETREHFNACGGGAIAAMLAACREAGASVGRVLRHQNSYETLAGVMEQDPTDAVGYAAVVVT